MKRELNYEGFSPLLYLVATPIGNLSEFSPRAKETLAEVDYVACEDTRNSGLLLAHFGLKKQLISCHEHNEEAASEKIVALLKEGKKVAYVSDAGYPSISDPGERLVRKALENGIKIAVINGPNAALCAIAGSGLNTDHFYFEGFLPAKENERDKQIRELSARRETIVFYEAPHRIKKTLTALYAILGNRKACLARELTKTHEEYIRGTLGELAALEEATLLGEMVLVVEGDSSPKKEIGEEEILGLLREASATLSPRMAAKEISEKTGWAKNRIYDLYLTKIKKI
jgi:16S rRNA (cytidine1402-2'-O)-methyltransferase